MVAEKISAARIAEIMDIDNKKGSLGVALSSQLPEWKERSLQALADQLSEVEAVQKQGYKAVDASLQRDPHEAPTYKDVDAVSFEEFEEMQNFSGVDIAYESQDDGKSGYNGHLVEEAEEPHMLYSPDSANWVVYSDFPDLLQRACCFSLGGDFRSNYSRALVTQSALQSDAPELGIRIIIKSVKKFTRQSEAACTLALLIAQLSISENQSSVMALEEGGKAQVFYRRGLEVTCRTFASSTTAMAFAAARLEGEKCLDSFQKALQNFRSKGGKDKK